MPRPHLPKATLVVRHAAVATCAAGPSDAGVLVDGAVAVSGHLVAWVGPDSALAGAVELAGAETVDAGGRLVTPGLVDSHTHLLFAGDRAVELAERAAGRTYLEIADAGGGILATVRATAAATDEALLDAAAARVRRLLAQGVTTVEVKSGYGLTVERELRLLRLLAALEAAVQEQVTLVPTLLAAHALPPERADDRERYVRELCEELIPAAAAAGQAAFCDAFVERG